MLAVQFDKLSMDRWTPGDRYFTDNGWYRWENLVPMMDGPALARKFADIVKSAAIGATANDLRVRGSFYVPSVPGGVGAGVYVGTEKRLALWDSTGWTDLSTGGAAYANAVTGVADWATAPAVWSFCMFGPTRLVATSRENLVQTRTSAGGNFAALITSAEKPQGRYCAAVRGHLVLANILDPAGPTTYPSRVYWSARNNAAVFTPDTDRCGFIDMSDDGSSITGLVGYESYFTVITENGVYQFTWTGGPYVWERTLLGGAPFGCRAPMSVVRHGADIYYLSTGGPAVIRNGQSPQLLGGPAGMLLARMTSGGDVRRYSLTTSSFGQAWGLSDPTSNVVGWAYNGQGGDMMLLYNPVTQEWGQQFLPTRTDDANTGSFSWDALSFAPAPMTNSGASLVLDTPGAPYLLDPLSGLALIASVPGSAKLRAYRVRSDQNGLTAAVLWERLWQPPGGGRTQLHGLRWRHYGVADQLLTVSVSPYPSGQINSITSTVADQYPGTFVTLVGPDANGWYMVPGGPISAPNFVLRLSVAGGGSTTRNQALIDAGWVELAHIPEASDFG